MKNLRNRHFSISIDERKGIVTSLRHPSAKSGVNFILSPDAHRDIRLPEASWFGSIKVGYKTPASNNWEFAERPNSNETPNCIIRRAENSVELCHKPASELRDGLKHFSIKKEFILSKSKPYFEWRISVCNPNNYDIEIGELSLPIPFNSSVRGLKVSEMYAQRVIIHPFIAGHSSYIFIQRLDGLAPYLLMIPDDNTPLECLAQPEVMRHIGLKLAGGGIKRLYVHSAAAKESLSWKNWFHGHSSTVLKARGSLEYGFKFLWANTFEEIEDMLYGLGKAAFRVMPGMVLPEGTPARLLIRTKKKIRKITARNATVTMTAKDTYSIRLRGTGLRRFEIHYGKNEWAALVFNSIPPIERLIKARARFIAKHQQVNDKKNDRYGAFMMWDAEEKAMVFKAPAPYFYGCSDELGFADPLFLSAKNVRYPEAKEISALEKYIDRFLFGKIQDKADYGVCLWYGEETWRHYRGSDKVRSFNYPHVFNIYYSMYLIDKYYGLTRSRGANEYLKMAYRTAMAFYQLKMIAGDSYTIGNMGASMLLKLLDALKEEGMFQERACLFAFMRKSAANFVKTKYPYGSEFSYDTTGLETVYFFRKYISKQQSKAIETLRCALALRHRHPLWCQSGNDVRCGMGNGKAGERGWDEICFSYMAPLNGWTILDAFAETNDPRLIETGYAGILGCWSLVDADGTGHNLYTHEPEAMFMDAWTSEMGLALFASLESMGAYVVNDADFGIAGYGCDVQHAKNGMAIAPKEWARSGIIDMINRISIKTPNGIIKRMTVHKGGRAEIALEPVLKTQREILVKARHLDGKAISIDDDKAHVHIMKSAGGEITVRISSAIIRLYIRFE